MGGYSGPSIVHFRVPGGEGAVLASEVAVVLPGQMLSSRIMLSGGGYVESEEDHVVLIRRWVEALARDSAPPVPRFHLRTAEEEDQ